MEKDLLPNLKSFDKLGNLQDQAIIDIMIGLMTIKENR